MKLVSHLHVPLFASAALLVALGACDGGSQSTEGSGGSGTAPTGGTTSTGTGDGGDAGLFNTGDEGGGPSTSSTDSTSSSTTKEDPNGLCDSATPTDGASTWTKKAGAANVQSGLGIAADPQGNVFVSGAFLGTIDFGAGALTSAGQNDAYVAKLDANGNALWTKRFGDAQYHQYAQHLAADPQGNVLVWGHFRGSVNFGGSNINNTSNFFEDVFLAKLDANGGHVWSKGYGDINNEESQAIATDAQGNVIVVGAFQKSINFGGGVLESDYDTFSAFVAKLAANGSQVWAKRVGDAPDGPNAPNPDPYEQKALGVTTDGAGNVYVVGYHQNVIDFGGGPLTAEGTNKNAFVAKLGPDGAFVWAKTYGLGEASAVDVAVDPSGNVFVLGNFKGEITFGDKTFNAGVANNLFFLKLDSAGNLLWAKNYGQPNVAEEAKGLALHGDKPVILGMFTGEIDLGDGPLVSAGGFDVFLAKFDNEGCVSHARSYGAAMLQRGEALTVDATGNALFTGSFDGMVDFGTGALTADSTDSYAVKTKP